MTDRDDYAATMLAMGESEPRAVDPRGEALFDAPTRYIERRVLGAGGMGEVRLCSDLWIGRDVAMKVVRTGTGSGSTSETRGRFLREARVQGQLEHPSVVPVYDLGRVPTGESFFTMKRIDGHTLERVIAGLRDGDSEIAAMYTRRKLLSATSQVCLTVAYAHSRGVVHRDLKPANVMLGDFGEVYVLDWGVARIAGATEPTHADVISGADSLPHTHAGALVGTPGHMSPEQARGDVEAIGPATDVYALGAMLFEVLALEPLHQGTSVAELIVSAQRKTEPPSARAGAVDVPPELDAVCVRATELAPEDRFASARAMHDAIERYLDGERDDERRRLLAKEHVARAFEMLGQSRAGGHDAEQLRAAGMRALGRAIALDPSDEGALRAVFDLIQSDGVPDDPKAKAELYAVELRDRAAASGRIFVLYVAWLAVVPACFLMGIKSWLMFASLVALIVISGAYFFWMSKDRAQPKYMRFAIWLTFIVIGLCTTMFGPFVMAPGIAISSIAGFGIGIRANAATRRGMFAGALLSIFAPAGLQWLGVLPASYSFEHGIIQIHPFLVDFPPTLTPLVLMGVTIIQIVSPALVFGRAIDALIQAERRNFAQAWRLRQLLPAAPAGR